MNNYSEKVMDHFMNPKNMGEIENADAIGEVKNPVCGDVTRIYLKIKKISDKSFVEEIKFKTFGCAAAIASSSVLTELVKGKSLDDCKKLKKEQIIECLGNLPEGKIHCSLLADDALKEAIKSYENENS